MALPRHACHDLRSNSDPSTMSGSGPNLVLPKTRSESRRNELVYPWNRRVPKLETNAYHPSYCQGLDSVLQNFACRGPCKNRLQPRGLGLRLGKNLDGSIRPAIHWLERDARVNGRHLRRPFRAPRSRHTPSCHSNSPSAEQSRTETKNTKCA
jgi:hypothetical protein